MYVIKIEQDKNTDMKMDLKVLCVQIVYSFGTIISYIIHTVSSHYVCKDMYICIIVFIIPSSLWWTAFSIPSV